MRGSDRARQYGIGALACALLLVVGCGGDPPAEQTIHRQRGERYLAEDKYPEAIIELKNATKANPRDAHAFYALATAHLKHGTGEALQEAFFALRKCVELDPHRHEAQLKLSEIYFSINVDGTRRFDQALQHAELVLQDDATNVDAYVLAGWAHVSNGARDKAIAALEKARELDPTRHSTYIALAALYQLGKDLSAAERLYTAASKVDPQSLVASLALGAFYASQRNFAKAEAHYQTALAQHPENVLLRLHLASLYVMQGKRPEAITAYQRAIQDDHHDIRALVRLPEDIMLHLQLADVYAVQNRRPDAEAEYHKAAALAPQDIRALLALADFYVQTQQYERAQGTYRQVVERAPTLPAAHEKLAELALRQHQFEAATQHIDALLAMPAGRVFTACLALARNQFPAAIAILQETLRRLPRSLPSMST